MEMRHIAIIAASSTVLVVVVIAIVASLDDDDDDDEGRGEEALQDHLDPSKCPAGYGDRPLLLVSLDGFRADYLHRGLTPTIEKLAKRGVYAPFMRSTYPTVTFPNHYSIVTGLYPESHGIINNVFFDSEFQSVFSIKSSTKFEGKWWGGEPIWNTLTKLGKKSASFFWPGSDADIQGMRPTYWFQYNKSIPFQQRVEQVLDWLSLPAEDRPSWVCMYSNEPDKVGHNTGPFSPELDEELRKLETDLARLMEGLRERRLEHCVNLLLISDHGMAKGGREKVIQLDRYVPDIFDEADVFHGPAPRIRPLDFGNIEGASMDLLRRLSCQRKEMRVFLREDLPKRIHYTNNKRIDSIVLDLDPGYTVEDVRPDAEEKPVSEGQHGYDYYFPEMDALFVALGPDLKQGGLEVEPFQNIELYNLMALLTGMPPAPNNGTWGALHHLLANPPAPEPSLPQQEAKPPSLTYPGDGAGSRVTPGCDGDLAGNKTWLTKLDLTEAQRKEAEAGHLPWGVPRSSGIGADAVLLHHPTHVTGYSRRLKLPLWTGFTVEAKPAKPSGGPEPKWSGDPRLGPEATASCDDYGSVSGLAMAPLFPPGMAPDADVPLLLSSAVAMSDQLSRRWNQLVWQLVPGWIDAYGPVNVVSGPAFDVDADSLRDDFAAVRTPSVPTDVFAVVTRCSQRVTSLDLCPQRELDAIGFIFPQFQAVSNCMSAKRFALMYSCKVRDVELATGLTFFPDLPFEDRVRIALRIHSDLWD